MLVVSTHSGGSCKRKLAVHELVESKHRLEAIVYMFALITGWKKLRIIEYAVDHTNIHLQILLLGNVFTAIPPFVFVFISSPNWISHIIISV